MQLRSDVQRLLLTCAHSDAFRLIEFVAFLTLLWQIRQLLFWFLFVQLRADVQRPLR